MKTKTSELTDRALDWAVVSIECARPAPFKSIPAILDGTVRIVRADIGAHSMPVSPSTDWAQGGPIIERERISISPPLDPLARQIFKCTMIGFRRSSKGGSVSTINSGYGPTPLIAAMRCYVASKLGDEVAIPEELTQ